MFPWILYHVNDPLPGFRRWHVKGYLTNHMNFLTRVCGQSGCGGPEFGLRSRWPKFLVGVVAHDGESCSSINLHSSSFVIQLDSDLNWFRPRSS